MSSTPIYDEVAGDLAWTPEQLRPAIDLDLFVRMSYDVAERRWTTTPAESPDAPG